MVERICVLQTLVWDYKVSLLPSSCLLLFWRTIPPWIFIFDHQFFHDFSILTASVAFTPSTTQFSPCPHRNLPLIQLYTMSSTGDQDDTALVHVSYLGGYIFLSYVISLMGCATTLELLHRRTSRSGFYNWFAHCIIRRSTNS